jgi:hypothetical protein
MSGQLGGVLFVAATGALALWWIVRRPSCPATLMRVIGHAVLALGTLQLSALLVRADSPAWWRFSGLLAVMTPALVYTWLSAAWMALFVRAARHGAAR